MLDDMWVNLPAALEGVHDHLCFTDDQIDSER